MVSLPERKNVKPHVPGQNDQGSGIAQEARYDKLVCRTWPRGERVGKVGVAEWVPVLKLVEGAVTGQEGSSLWALWEQLAEGGIGG